MERKNNIWGEIYGISKESFELLREDLEQVFNIVNWQNNNLVLERNGKHYDNKIYAVYDKIAFCIDGDNGGGELEERENSDDFSSVFFCPCKWEQVWGNVVYPQNPFE